MWQFTSLTLMLLVANFANWYKMMQNKWINDWNPGTEYSVRAFQWIRRWQGLDGFQESLCLVLWMKVASSLEGCPGCPGYPCNYKCPNSALVSFEINMVWGQLRIDYWDGYLTLTCSKPLDETIIRKRRHGLFPWYFQKHQRVWWYFWKGNFKHGWINTSNFSMNWYPIFFYE